ncbi:MAG TPA: 6-bladed beta-propeller [Longimicrobiales bacterium]
MANGVTRWAAGLAIALTAAPAAAQQTVLLPAKDVALRDRAADVYTVGTVEGRDWEMFSDIRALGFDRSDNLYVLDGQNFRVVVFDVRGRFVRQFGKQGGGPGEFQAPLSLDVAPDGTIVVSDIGNRAFILFTPAGEYIRNVPFADELGLPIGGIEADAAGGVLTRSMARIRPDQPPTESARFSTIYRQTLDATATRATPLYRVPMPPPRVSDAGSATGQRRVAAISMDPVFGARPTFGSLRNGLAVHHETSYGIRILDADGRPVRTLTRDIEPRKVTKKDQEEWQKRRAEEEANGVGPRTVMVTRSDGASPSVSIGRGGDRGPRQEALRMTLENTPFAEYMSVVSSIRTDPQGRIWAQRRLADGRAAGPIDLLTPEGRYIGTLPAQALPNAVSESGLAAWIVTDDLGVEKVTVRRLPASWR